MLPIIQYGLESTAILKGAETPSSAVAGIAGLTAPEIAASNAAAAYDIKLRFFALGDSFKTLTIADNFPVDGDPVGWNIGTEQIIPASPWVEVTTYIHFNGSFDYEWDDNKITWSCTLHGQNYDAGYFGVGQALLCLRKVTFTGYDSGWRLWWLGCVESGGYTDNYKHGMEWRRVVKGTNISLKTTDSPRITVGKTNLARDGSITVSSTLAIPAEEISKGEFIGSTANVDSGNIIDGRLNTPWIAQYPPSVIADELPLYHVEQERLKIDEVFFMPVTGYDPAKCWWFEIVALADDLYIGGGAWADGWIATFNADGIPVALHLSGHTSALKRGQRVVVCANRKRFEEYTGGGNGAAHIFEADTLPECYRIINYELQDNPLPDTYRFKMNLDTSQRLPFTLNPNGGYIYQSPYWYQQFSNGDCVKWGYDEAFPPGTRSGELWVGVTVTNPSTSQSIRRLPSGGGVGTGYGSNNYDSNTAADWIASDYPRPGDKYTINQFEWVLLELDAHTSTLATAIDPTTTSITFDEGVEGWPPSGYGVIESDVFHYASRSSSALTEVTGLTNNHVVGALAYPYADNIAQTGWLVSSLKIRRPIGATAIKRLSVYFSPYPDTASPDGLDPTNVLWHADYPEPHLEYYNGLNGYAGPIGTSMSDIYLEPITDTSRWIRSILVLIHEMYPDAGDTEPARAKVNEIEVYPDDLTTNENLPLVTTPDGTQQSTAAEAIRYLLANYSWLTEDDIRNDTFDGWGYVHSFSSAIAPITDVIEDLARTHGCVVHYHPCGKILIERDPWWPGGLDQAAYYYVGGLNYGIICEFTRNELRDDYNIEDSLPDVTGVALIATDSLGNPLQRVTVPPGATGTTTKEFTDITVPNSAYAQDMAYKLQMRETDTRRARFTIKGPGEWLRPGYIIQLGWEASTTSSIIEYWIVEGIHYSWSQGGGQKHWTAQVDARRFY